MEVNYVEYSDYITFYQKYPSLESGYRLVDEPVETGDGYIAHLTRIHRNTTQNSPDSGMDYIPSYQNTSQNCPDSGMDYNPSYQNTKKYKSELPRFRYGL